MDPFSLVDVHCGSIYSAPLRGILLLVSTEGFYRIKLEMGCACRIAHFPIASTILIAAEVTGAPADRTPEVGA